MKYDLINYGSVHDIRSSLKCHPDSYSAEYLQLQVQLEKQGRNRVTVVKLLEATIKRKQKQNNQ